MEFLTRKYPFTRSGHNLRDSLFYGAIVWAILYLLQPFGFSAYSGNKFVVAGLFGLVTTCCCFLYEWLFLNHITERVKPWRIWHQGCAVLGLIVFIAICSMFLFSYIFQFPVSADIFIRFLYWTLSIGVIITVLTVGLAYQRYMREKLETLLSNTTEEQKDTCITIHDTTVRGNDLTIPINDLLYIEAQKNNVAVCCMKDGQLVTVEVRSTLSAVVEELKEFKNIFQCHRSFVVNVNNITSAKGNSNGYQLTLGACTVSIPVSRSYVPRLKEYID